MSIRVEEIACKYIDLINEIGIEPTYELIRDDYPDDADRIIDELDTGLIRQEDIEKEIEKVDEDIVLNKDKEIILALVSTAKQATDLENVYDDDTGKSYPWWEVMEMVGRLK